MIIHSLIFHSCDLFSKDKSSNIFLLHTGAGPMDLNALKTAAISVTKRASGTTENLPHASNLPLYPRILKFKLRIKDPLVTKQGY